MLVELNLHSRTFTKSTWLETALLNILNGSKSFDNNIKPSTINITLSWMSTVIRPILLLITYVFSKFCNFLLWTFALWFGAQKKNKPTPRIWKKSSIMNFTFLRDYFIFNDLIWQDGFLIDFLQKKIADKWIRKFVVYSGYFFNERWLFDHVVRFYINLVIWPGYSVNIYEFNNVASTLLVTLFLAMSLFLVIGTLYFWVLVF